MLNSNGGTSPQVRQQWAWGTSDLLLRPIHRGSKTIREALATLSVGIAVLPTSTLSTSKRYWSIIQDLRIRTFLVSFHRNFICEAPSTYSISILSPHASSSPALLRIIPSMLCILNKRARAPLTTRLADMYSSAIAAMLSYSILSFHLPAPAVKGRIRMCRACSKFP